LGVVTIIGHLNQVPWKSHQGKQLGRTRKTSQGSRSLTGGARCLQLQPQKPINSFCSILGPPYWSLSTIYVTLTDKQQTYRKSATASSNAIIGV